MDWRRSLRGCTKPKPLTGKLVGNTPCKAWIVVPAHALLGIEDEYWRAETGRHNDIALHSAVVDIASDSGQQLASLPEEKSGDISAALREERSGRYPMWRDPATIRS